MILLISLDFQFAIDINPTHYSAYSDITQQRLIFEKLAAEKYLPAIILTVNGDVYSLDVCVDIVDSCAFVRPCSLSGDRWDFQVLVV